MKTKTEFFKIQKESGMSIVNALVGVALTSVTAVYLSQIMGSGFKSQKSPELRAEKSSVLQYLTPQVDCAQTSKLNSCPSNGPVKLLGSAGKVLVSNTGTGTKIGSWTLRAECDPSGSGYTIKAVRLKPGKSLTSTVASDFFADPLTGKLITWNNADALLLPNDMSLCSADTASSSTGKFEDIIICTTVNWPFCSTDAEIGKYFTLPPPPTNPYLKNTGNFVLKSQKTCTVGGASYTAYVMPKLPPQEQAKADFVANTPWMDNTTFNLSSDGRTINIIQPGPFYSFKCR